MTLPRRDVQISFLAWVVLGLLAGFIGSKIVIKSGEGIVTDIILGRRSRGRRMAIPMERCRGFI
jgi:hypothetical protein